MRRVSLPLLVGLTLLLAALFPLSLASRRSPAPPGDAPVLLLPEAGPTTRQSPPCGPWVWEIQTADGGGGAGFYTSLALDTADRPHISHCEVGTGLCQALKYAEYDGSAWYIQTIDSYLGVYTSLALDAADRPRIAYSAYGSLKYASYDGSAWQIQEVDRNGVGYGTSLGLDASDRPHISYFDEGQNSLKYAVYDGRAWVIQLVDPPPAGFWYTSLALDATGQPRIAYYGGYRDLKYAVYDAGSWKVEKVESAGDVGAYTSLALDAAGYPHISYYDDTNDDLKYAYRDAAGWHIATVDSAGNVGSFTSLALDAAGHPHISYYDFSHYALKYACYDGATWTIQTASRDDGRWSSLKLDAAGYPHISYSGYSGLEYARAIGPCAPANGATFTWTPPTPTAGQVVTFTGSASGTRPIAYAWDFGDGAPGAGITATHTYPAAGAYTVTLEATNCGLDQGVTVTRALTVACAGLAGLDFAWSPRAPTAGLPLRFTAVLTGGTAPFTYTWALGDGGAGTGETVTHTYQTAGLFTVSLVVTDACGSAVVGHALAVLPPHTVYLPLVTRRFP